MTKDVLLSMKGIQFGITDDNGKAEDVDVITNAEYYNRNGRHFVLFEETQEKTGDKIKSMIKFDDKLMEVTRRGAINTHMIFDMSAQNMSDYSTPYRSMLVGIDTRNISLTEQENRISVQVDYGLAVNYEHLSDCRINMEICPRESSEMLMNN